MRRSYGGHGNCWPLEKAAARFTAISLQTLSSAVLHLSVDSRLKSPCLPLHQSLASLKVTVGLSAESAAANLGILPRSFHSYILMALSHSTNHLEENRCARLTRLTNSVLALKSTVRPKCPVQSDCPPVNPYHLGTSEDDRAVDAAY